MDEATREAIKQANKDVRNILDTVSKFPYITKLDYRTFCSQWVSSNGRPAKCREQAMFHYKAGSTKKPHVKSGNYCWKHLITKAIRGTKYDEARAERAFQKLMKEQEA